jgi:hypothetical protein
MTGGSFSHLSQTFGSSAFIKLISDWFVPGLERNAKRTRFRRYGAAQGGCYEAASGAFQRRRRVAVHRHGAAEEQSVSHRGTPHTPTEQRFGWIVSSDAMMKQYDCYAMDADSGPFF